MWIKIVIYIKRIWVVQVSQIHFQKDSAWDRIQKEQSCNNLLISEILKWQKYIWGKFYRFRVVTRSFTRTQVTDIQSLRSFKKKEACASWSWWYSACLTITFILFPPHRALCVKSYLAADNCKHWELNCESWYKALSILALCLNGIRHPILKKECLTARPEQWDITSSHSRLKSFQMPESKSHPAYNPHSQGSTLVIIIIDSKKLWTLNFSILSIYS